MHKIDQFYPLGFFPTPLVQLKNFERDFPDYSIYIKRDDLTGLALGGNKTRKLEYLLWDAISKRSDSIITAGAQQSNHCRQTAAAAAIAGLECNLLLGGKEPAIFNGNILLDKILKAKIYYTDEERKGESIEKLEKELKNQGKQPYIIPYGGSNRIGALGFVKAMQELSEQSNKLKLSFDYIFFASSSGGTQAGMLAGTRLYNLSAKITGINIDKSGEGGMGLKTKIVELTNQLTQELSINPSFELKDVTLLCDYDHPGYGVLTQNEKDVIQALAGKEGVLLDPVYTGRAFYAMTTLLKNKEIPKGSKVLFWHTGGIPANFVYGNDLV